MTEPTTEGPTPTPDARALLVRCFNEVFPQLDEDQIVVAEHSHLQEWDSLASITLVVIIEEEFRCTLPDDLVAELTSFERILAVVAPQTD